MLKNNKKDTFRDDEVQMLGTVDPFRSRKKRLRNWMYIILFAVAAILIVLGLIFLRPGASQPDDVEGLFESSAEKYDVEALGTSQAEKAYAERLDTIVNDHSLIIFIPHHAKPHLTLGNPDDRLRKQSILAFQAADIRADNKEILGEFVLEGRQLSQGKAKKGYCAIIDDKVTISAGEKTTLLSDAISSGGYFFRQYPIVYNGTPIDNKPKGKTIRRALCERNGQIFVAVSAGDEPLNDFAHMLATIGVDNAIYLVGGKDAYGWAVDADGNLDQFGHEGYITLFENESYIVWE